jgi:hypothetical protein
LPTPAVPTIVTTGVIAASPNTTASNRSSSSSRPAKPAAAAGSWAWGNGRGGLIGGLTEPVPIGRGQAERVGQQPDRERAGCGRLSAFDLPEGPDAHPDAGGQLFLRQSQPPPVRADDLAEIDASAPFTPHQWTSVTITAPLA